MPKFVELPARSSPSGSDIAAVSAGGTTYRSTLSEIAASIKIDDLALPDDNTDLDVSTTRHGLVPKLPGGTTTFLRADGTYAAPSASGLPVVDTTSLVEDPGDATKEMRIDVGAVSTATVRVLTMPDQDVDLTPNTGTFPSASHASRHQNGGADEVSVDGLSGLLADGQIPLAHATSHQNGGSDEIAVTGLSGLLADGQTPLAHAASHQSGGSDAVKLDDFATPDDNTDLNASTTRHGLLPKLSNVATAFLDGQGNWNAPIAFGTWTPTIGGSTSESGQAYSVQYGTYAKIGRLVLCWATVQLSTLGTITGSVQFKGLPFTSSNADANYRSMSPVNWSNLTTALVLAQASLANNATVMTLLIASAATTSMTGVAAVQGDLSATSRFVLSFQYLTD